MTSDFEIELLVTSVSICLFQVLTDCFFASVISAATAANGTSPAFPNLPFGVSFHLDQMIFRPFSSQTLYIVCYSYYTYIVDYHTTNLSNWYIRSTCCNLTLS